MGKRGAMHLNESTLIYDERQKNEMNLKKIMNLQNSMEFLDMSSKINLGGGKTVMGYSSYMGEKK